MVVFEGLVGKLADGLRHGAERGRQLHPSHGASHGDPDELGFITVLGEDHSQSQAVKGLEEEVVESILAVLLAGVDRTVLWVGMANIMKDVWQGTPELRTNCV